jgi:hypothetical protein
MHPVTDKCPYCGTPFTVDRDYYRCRACRYAVDREGFRNSVNCDAHHRNSRHSKLYCGDTRVRVRNEIDEVNNEDLDLAHTP